VLRVQLFAANLSGEWNGPDQAFALAGASDSIFEVRSNPFLAPHVIQDARVRGRPRAIRVVSPQHSVPALSR
jgi:hypothetical protein